MDLRTRGRHGRSAADAHRQSADAARTRSRGTQPFVRVLSVPLLGGVGGFMVPMHGIKVVEAFHEPPWPSNRSLPWESGAEDARTPNADASSADSAASAKRFECVRFIGAFCRRGTA